MKGFQGWTLGGAGVTFPAWGEALTTGWQGLVGVMGAVVLVLTIYNKILEAKQRRRDLAG
jgi:hypothetical protein